LLTIFNYLWGSINSNELASPLANFIAAISGISSAPPAPFGRRYPARLARPSDDSITLLSANLWHDYPKHRRQMERLEAFAQLVEQQNADIVMLQEVAHTSDLHADEWLAKRLRMSYFYSRANGNERAIGFEEGLAVLSRFPLGEPQHLSLGGDALPFTRRWALGVEVETHVGKLMAVSTHLALSPLHNKNQLARLRSWVAGMSGEVPVLIGGDFNAHESSAQINQTQHAWLDIFRQVNPHMDGTTFEREMPGRLKNLRLRFDYLFLQPGDVCWKTLHARHLFNPGRPHSDHRAVLARLAPIPCA